MINLNLKINQPQKKSRRHMVFYVENPIWEKPRVRSPRPTEIKRYVKKVTKIYRNFSSCNPT